MQIDYFDVFTLNTITFNNGFQFSFFFIQKIKSLIDFYTLQQRYILLLLILSNLKKNLNSNKGFNILQHSFVPRWSAQGQPIQAKVKSQLLYQSFITKLLPLDISFELHWNKALEYSTILLITWRGMVVNVFFG